MICHLQVQVLAQIEQHLCNITNNTSLDEQRSAKDEQSMQLFLAGCKLLETLCILPSGYVSQFQMCRWTFVAPMNARTMSELFVPFAVKLDQLLSTKVIFKILFSIKNCFLEVWPSNKRGFGVAHCLPVQCENADIPAGIATPFPRVGTTKSTFDGWHQ